MAPQSSQSHRRSRSREGIIDGLKRRISVGKNRTGQDRFVTPTGALLHAGLMSGSVGLAGLGSELRHIAVDEEHKDRVRDMLQMEGSTYEVSDEKARKSGSETSMPSITVTTSSSSSGSTEENASSSPASLPPEDVFEYDTLHGLPTEIPPETAVVDENVFQICAFTKQKDDLIMRVLLDTGCGINLIAYKKATETGHEIEEYTGERLITANGETFRPIGQMKLQWHFRNRGNERTYGCVFLVISDRCPYDAVLGFQFISRAQIFTLNNRAFVLVPQKTSKEEERKRELREREKRERNIQLKEKEREKRRETISKERRKSQQLQ